MSILIFIIYTHDLTVPTCKRCRQIRKLEGQILPVPDTIPDIDYREQFSCKRQRELIRYLV